MIVKISTSGDHCLALSATSEVYGWGDNESGQLGQTALTITRPQNVVVHGHLPCWDVAAGKDQSLVICDGITSGDSGVYFCGLDEQDVAVRQLARSSAFKGLGIVHGVFAGFQTSACLIDARPQTAVYELASSQRLFHVTVKKILTLFVRPLLDSEHSLTATTVQNTSLRGLYETLNRLSRITAVAHLETTRVLRGSLTVAQSMLVREAETWLMAYQSYFNVYNSMLACGAFDKCVKCNR